MRCLYALLAMVALAAGAALPTVEQLADRLSALEADKSLEHAARLSDLKLADSTAEQSETAEDTLDKVERGGYDSYNPYGGYPYGGYGGYPYGGYGGYPYGGFGGYPPFGGYGGYPSFGGYPFGGGSSSANAVAVSNGGGFFGGSSNANAVAVSGGGGGGGGGFGRRRRDVDAVQAVEAAKERIAEIEQKSVNKAEKRAEIDAVKQSLAETLMTDVARKLESVQKIKQLMQSERILSFLNNQAINSVAVATNNGIFGNANAASTAAGSGIGRRDLSAANMKADLADSLVADAIQKLKAADEISKVIESERILGSLQSTQNINAIAVSTNNGIFGNSDANSFAIGS